MQRRTPQLPAELVERILELAMLSIDLHPAHLDELDAWPESDEIELERRYARSRELNPELYVLGARCCLVSRRWSVISRRLLYTSIKMDACIEDFREFKGRPTLVSSLEQSHPNAALVTSFTCQSIPEHYIPLLLPLLPNLVQLDLGVFYNSAVQYRRQRDTSPFRRARFDHLRRLSVRYLEPYDDDYWAGSLRSILKVLCTVSTLERLDLAFFDSWESDSMEEGFDWDGREPNSICPFPSFSLEYLRLGHMGFQDYDVSPLLVASSSTLRELVLDDFQPIFPLAFDRAPAFGMERMLEAVKSCYDTLERLSMRYRFEPLTLGELLFDDEVLPALQYLHMSLCSSNNSDVRQQLVSITAPRLRHLSLTHHSTPFDLVDEPWVDEMIIKQNFPSLERWTFDTDKTRANPTPNSSKYSTDQYQPRFEFDPALVSSASSVGVRLVSSPRMSRWSEEVGRGGESFCERIDLLDLRELLALRGSHLVSRSYIVENNTDTSAAGNGRPGDDDGGGLRDRVGVIGVGGSRL
jgi:hypothetical protein